jgi:hypothetical protein
MLARTHLGMLFDLALLRCVFVLLGICNYLTIPLLRR